MPKNQYLTRGLLIGLAFIWIGSGFVAILGTTYVGLSPLQITGIVGVVGTLGILTVQLIRLVQPEAQQQTVSNDTTNSANKSTEPTVEGQSRETATSGLSPSERRLQNKLIKTAYRDFADNPFHFITHRRTPNFVNELAEDIDSVDAETAQKVWRITVDDGFFQRSPGAKSLKFTPKAVRRAEALGENILIDDTIQDEVLEVLLEAYLEDPDHPRISRDELIEAVGFGEDEIDHNVWFLEAKRFVETQTFLGVKEGYKFVEITSTGRKVAE